MNFDKIRQDFQDVEYAYAYANGHLDSYIATQIKVLREERGLTQQELAVLSGMRQARISVLENVNYSAWSVSTLRRIAKSLGVRLKVSFEEFGTLLPELCDFNRESLERRALQNDPAFSLAHADMNSLNQLIMTSSFPGSMLQLNETAYVTTLNELYGLSSSVSDAVQVGTEHATTSAAVQATKKKEVTQLALAA